MDINNFPTEYGIGFLRVSSPKQGLQGDPDTMQKEQIEMRRVQLSSQLGKNIVIDIWPSYYESASGDILDLQPFYEVLELCKKNPNHYKYAFFKSIDRGTRAGAIMYGRLKAEFTRYGLQLVDVYGVIGTQEVNTLAHLGIEYKWSKYSPTWITELLEAERAKSEVRDILSRMIGAEIDYTRKGYAIRQAPFGYVNFKKDTPHGKRVLRAPHPEESNWIIRMFELRAQGNLTDDEIVGKINKMGYKSRIQNIHDRKDKDRKVIGTRGGVELTVDQLLRFIERPIYAGINAEKWTDGKPVKCQFDGLITIDIFNKANKGKKSIIFEDNIYTIVSGTPEEWRLRKDKNNPLYPHKPYVTCPWCLQPLNGSASTGKGGIRHPAYHCNRTYKHEGKPQKTYRIPLKNFNETIEKFCENIQFSDEFKIKFRAVVLEEWEKRESNLSSDTAALHQNLSNIEHEILNLKDTIKRVKDSELIQEYEQELQELKMKRLNGGMRLSKQEDEQLKVETVVNQIEYFMEHPQEMLFGSSNPHQNAAMFGLLFEELPTYEDIKYGTPKLACIVRLNDTYKASKKQFVTRMGVEPMISGMKAPRPRPLDERAWMVL